jgi:hypothetical protein
MILPVLSYPNARRDAHARHGKTAGVFPVMHRQPKN